MDVKFFLFLAYGSDSNSVLYFGSAVGNLYHFDQEQGHGVAIGQGLGIFSSTARSHERAIKILQRICGGSIRHILFA
jgi:hypothetical protein